MDLSGEVGSTRYYCVLTTRRAGARGIGISRSNGHLSFASFNKAPATTARFNRADRHDIPVCIGVHSRSIEYKSPVIISTLQARSLIHVTS